MARRSIEDVMNDIEDFLASCKTAALSSNKIVVPKDEFEDLFGELKVKIPAEIDRCKKIMRNKEAILMNARKDADKVIADANAMAQQMVAETTIVQQANQQAYEMVEMAKAQADEIVATAIAQSNEIRLGSMQYTNDIMMGIRGYVEATMEAERANYENLLAVLNNDLMVANANIEEVQSQIVQFTGDPNSVTKAPQMKTVADKDNRGETRQKTSVAQKVRQAVGMKEPREEKIDSKPNVEIPDFVSSGETVVPNETPLNAVNVPDNSAKQTEITESVPVESEKPVGNPFVETSLFDVTEESAVIGTPKVAPSTMQDLSEDGDGAGKKVKKKIIKKRNPVIHTPQTAQEAVAKTVEAATANKTEKTVYKANGEQAREVPPMEGKVKRGPRVGRGEVSEAAATSEETKSVGTLDDFSMEKKY